MRLFFLFLLLSGGILQPETATTAEILGQTARAGCIEIMEALQINPGGNRRLNWALHIIAIVRLRVDSGRSRHLSKNRSSTEKRGERLCANSKLILRVRFSEPCDGPKPRRSA
jgi:hypothetical protein